MTRRTAAAIVVLTPPPRLRLATAGPVVWLRTLQSRPAITPDKLPDPLQSSTRTGTTVAFLATPYVLPATVPATCVPCPLQSLVPLPSATVVCPDVSRSPNSACGATPESTT